MRAFPRRSTACSQPRKYSPDFPSRRGKRPCKSPVHGEGPRDGAGGLERLTDSRKRRTALSLCFHAIPDGKPLHTFPGIALGAFRSGFVRHGAKGDSLFRNRSTASAGNSSP
ncbi:hypothetical protein MPLB_660052 [Mesorhizobium sp. ORS 3324]|nr:hypothetical protein MPLB_660052 [Mesorhizobium sp. ORS 3324]